MFLWYVMMMKRRLKKLVATLSVIGLLTFTFTAGVLTAQTGLLPQLVPAHAAGTQQDLSVFWEGWNLIKAHFVDRAVLQQPNALAYAALKGLTTALGDTGHTRFLTPEEAQTQNTYLEGHFFGIGAYLGIDDQNRPFIISPFDGSPAQRAGLRAGDLLLQVDGVDISNETLDEIVGQIKGKKGTPVEIMVLHKGNAAPETITVIRDEINIPAVSWAFIPDSKIALIRLNQFSASANNELVTALQKAQAQKATALIVDVRGNAGGLLKQAVDVSSQFLVDGNVLQEVDAQGRKKFYPVRKGGVALKVPLVVLVNGGTASAAEIFAGAIQDHRRGQVIGETTFGTGTVLTPFTLSDGSMLLLGTSEWLTPNGRAIWKHGITPDIEVPLPPDKRILAPADVKQMTEEELFHAGDAQLLTAVKKLEAQ